MAPKKLLLHQPSKANDRVPQWRYRNDAKGADLDPASWTPYTRDQNVAIEAAYMKGLKTADIGLYYVDTKGNIQVNKLDALRSRKVKRFLVDPSEVAGWAATPSDATSSPSMGSTIPLKASSSVVVRDRPTGTPLDSPRPFKAPRVEVSSAPVPVYTAGSALPVPELPRATPSSSAAPSPSSTPSAAPQPLLNPANITFPERPKAKARPVVILSRNVSMEVVNVIQHVLATVPTINRGVLDAASILIGPTRRWLEALGRPSKQQGVFINIEKPLASLPDRAKLNLSSTHTISAQDARALADSAVVTYVGNRPDALLLYNDSQAKHASLSDKDHLKTQHLMISGKVHILYDGRYKPLPNPPTVITCSVPGINFAYSTADREAFTKQSTDDDGGSVVLDKEKALRRMRVIWQHMLLVMNDRYSVQYPVLCAIGCGAFRGPFGTLIPRLWGQALAEVVCNSFKAKVLKHVRTIFISLPTFGSDNNFAAFEHSIRAVLSANDDVDCAPIVLIEDASMIDIAITLAALPAAPVVGVLNPSDVQAIRHGWVGMYWDGGHIALEEVLAMQTTLLLHHVGLNKALFTDKARLLPVKKVLPDME